jgi:hypothetical protein
MTATARDLLSSIRSKNAGPFSLTFDLFFHDQAAYDRAMRSGLVDPEVIGARYSMPAEQVDIYPFPQAIALKISIPRDIPAGSPGDSDGLGGQQFVPLLDIEVPDAP